MNCSSFQELGDHSARSGGKARSLALLTAHGFPVPNGFVVLEDAFPLSAQDLAAVKNHSIEEKARRLQALILETPTSKELADEIAESLQELNGDFFAVRSSGSFEDGVSHAWAGIFESALNCPRTKVVSAVQNCWASLFSVRAFSYAQDRGVDLTVSRMAVIVQSMISSEVSGTAFSRHPVTRQCDRIVIESAFGLGEAVVSGAVTPDRFVVSKSEGSLLESSISSKERMLYRNDAGENAWKYLMRSESKIPSLSAAEIRELSDIVARIESVYAVPVDVEWARAEGRWYILQARPITA